MENAKRRIEYIDIIKGLAIITVLLGHCYINNCETTPFRAIIYSFHMPLFFILSGFFVATQRDHYSLETLKHFIHKNCITILLPFFIWGLIYTNFSFTNLLTLCFGSWVGFSRIQTLTSLWFLTVLFVSRIYLELFFMMVNKFKWNIKIAIAISIPIFFVIGFCLPHHDDLNTQMGNFFSYDIAFVASAFMLIGSLSRPVVEKLPNLNWLYLLLLIITFSALFVFFTSFTDYEHGFVLMANSRYYNPYVFIATALTGSFCVILLGLLIYKIPVKKNFLNFLGTNTIGIFLTHKHFESGLIIYLIANTSLNRSVINIIACCSTIIFVSLIVPIINKHAPVMFGKIKK